MRFIWWSFFARGFHNLGRRSDANFIIWGYETETFVQYYQIICDTTNFAYRDIQSLILISNYHSGTWWLSVLLCQEPTKRMIRYKQAFYQTQYRLMHCTRDALKSTREALNLSLHMTVVYVTVEMIQEQLPCPSIPKIPWTLNTENRICFRLNYWVNQDSKTDDANEILFLTLEAPLINFDSPWYRY